jgi:ankyrin repeat protein
MFRKLLLAVAALCASSLNSIAVAPGPSSDAFYQAIRTNDLTALDALARPPNAVNAPDADGATPLMYAAAVGSLEAMQHLLSAGADVNARNALGSPALTWATGDAAKVRLLLERGTNVNVVSATGQTPLLVAAMTNPSAEVVKLLIAHGADVKTADKLNATALHKAAIGGDVETLRILLDAGVDVNARDAADFTALMGATSNGSVAAVKLLLAHGARVNDASGGGEVITHKHGVQQNGVTALGSFTALLYAAVSAPVDVVRALLDAGADVNVRDVRGLTPLITAVATDHFQIETIRLLIARGARVNDQSLANETALDWAEKFRPTPVVRMLKQAGRCTA